MRFSLTVDMGNAAFDEAPSPELARILRDVATRVEDGEREGAVRDVNGNKVGTFKVVGRPRR